MDKLDNFPYKHIFYESDLPAAKKVVEFFEEYEQKKATHSATSLEGLSKKQLEELLYLDLSEQALENIPTKLSICKSLQILNLRIITALHENPNIELLSTLKHLKFLFLTIDFIDIFSKKDNSRDLLTVLDEINNLLGLHISTSSVPYIAELEWVHLKIYTAYSFYNLIMEIYFKQHYQ